MSDPVDRPRILISSSCKPGSYLKTCKRHLGDSQAGNQIQLCGLGDALATLVTLADFLKFRQLAVVQRIETGLEEVTTGSRVRQRARLEVMLVKGERFNEIIAQERAEQQALKAGRGTKSQQANQPQPRSQASASRADAAVSWRNVNNPDAAPLEDGDIGPLAESTASILEAGESRPNSNRRSSDSRRQTATRTAEQAAHESVSQKPRHRS